MSNSNYEIDLDDDEFAASISQKQQTQTTLPSSKSNSNDNNNNNNTISNNPRQLGESRSPKSDSSSRSPSNFHQNLHQPVHNTNSGSNSNNNNIPLNNNSQVGNNQFGGQFNQFNQNYGNNGNSNNFNYNNFNNYNNNNNNFNHYNFTQSFNPSTALLIQTFDWWVNEEDVRGYAVDVDEESAIKLVVFDEHKVNGKSKGVVYIDFNSIEAATKVKAHVEQTGKGENQQPLSVIFVSSTPNPFRTFTKNMNHNNNHHNSGNNNRGRPGNFGPRTNRMNFNNNNNNSNNNNNNGYYRNNSNSNNYNQFPSQFNYPQQYQGYQNNNQGYYNQSWPNQQGDGGNPHGQKRSRHD